MLAGEEEEGGWLYTELVVKGALKKKTFRIVFVMFTKQN